MIRLTRINRRPLVLNSDLIEHIEVTPDSVITMTTGQKIVVAETPEEIIERVVNFRRAIQSPLPGVRQQAHEIENEPVETGENHGR